MKCPDKNRIGASNSQAPSVEAKPQIVSSAVASALLDINLHRAKHKQVCHSFVVFSISGSELMTMFYKMSVTLQLILKGHYLDRLLVVFLASGFAFAIVFTASSNFIPYKLSLDS